MPKHQSALTVRGGAHTVHIATEWVKERVGWLF
jgi:hypothetical protein